ncbi:WD40 repeat-like protein, partial [Caulochytrium protostelioides]
MLKVSTANNVKVYSVAAAAKSAVPDWAPGSRNAKQQSKNAKQRAATLELLQDFEFPQASNCIRQSEDGGYILATGIYKPQIRCYDLSQSSLKFKRHCDAETVDFTLLAEDWTKVVMIQDNRTVEVHGQGGVRHKTRVPKFCRTITYHFPTCNAIIGGTGAEVYRLNLDIGQFDTPLETNLHGVNCSALSNVHQLLAFGGQTGGVELWDPRSFRRVASRHIGLDVLDAIAATSLTQESSIPEITALRYSTDGLSLAAGTSNGYVMVYDLRHGKPRLIKDHMNGLPIKQIHYHDPTDSIVSADAKVLKIWHSDRTGELAGKPITHIEPENNINDFIICKDSGFVAMANEGTAMQTYYAPILGPAPTWCPYLENITEEMEEKATPTFYDDYKFVTRSELVQLGLAHLVGTDVVKAYMHGYFIHLHLYRKAKAIAQPFEYDAYKREMAEKAVEEKYQGRINMSAKDLPQVNRDLAKRMLTSHALAKGSKSKRDTASALAGLEGATTANPTGDDRFANLFQDDDFAVDTTS